MNIWWHARYGSVCVSRVTHYIHEGFPRYTVPNTRDTLQQRDVNFSTLMSWTYVTWWPVAMWRDKIIVTASMNSQCRIVLTTLSDKLYCVITKSHFSHLKMHRPTPPKYINMLNSRARNNVLVSCHFHWNRIHFYRLHWNLLPPNSAQGICWNISVPHRHCSIYLETYCCSKYFKIWTTIHLWMQQWQSGFVLH